MLGKRINRSWVGRGSAKRDSHCWNLRKAWMNADARAQNSERELTVHGWEGGRKTRRPLLELAQDVDGSGRKGATLGKRINPQSAKRDGHRANVP